MGVWFPLVLLSEDFPALAMLQLHDYHSDERQSDEFHQNSVNVDFTVFEN